MVEIELKPCPFCGGTDSAENATQTAAVHLTDFRSAIGTRAFKVECIVCSVYGPSAPTPTSAIKLWNCRAALSVPAQGAEPAAWLIETFSDDGKECLNSQFVVIPSVAAGFNKPYHRVTPLYLHPTPAHSGEREALEQAAEITEILEECFEYFDNRQDADCDETGFIPNQEMVMATRINAVLKRKPHQ